MANSLTGAAGLLASLVGLAVLLKIAAVRGDPPAVVAGGLYGLTLVFLYVTTTLYHSESAPGPKRTLRVLDHCAVYLLIAGTYTPVAVVGIGGRSGWMLVGAAWLLALLGILFKVRRRFRHPGISMASYLVMGWFGVVALRPVLAVLTPQAVGLLAAGGIAYTAGTIFFGLERLPFNHAVWHLFVIAGSLCHYVAIAAYVIGS